MSKIKELSEMQIGETRKFFEREDLESCFKRKSRGTFSHWFEVIDGNTRTVKMRSDMILDHELNQYEKGL